MKTNVTDEQIARMLRARTHDPDPAVLDRLLANIEAAPQASRFRAGMHMWSPSRTLIAAALLLGLVAGTLAVLAGQPESPDPQRIISNGVVVVSDGCRLRTIDPVTGAEETLTPGFEGGCPGWPITYQVSWSADGEVLAYSSEFFCGGCGSPQAQTAVRDSGIWLLNTKTGTRTQFPAWLRTSSRLQYPLPRALTGCAAHRRIQRHPIHAH